MLPPLDGNNLAYPTGNLVADKAGNLFGTLGSGGAKRYGTVYEVTATGFATCCCRNDCRGQFHNAAEFRRLYPDVAAMAPLQPRLEDGFGRRALQDRIAARAGVVVNVQGKGALRGFVDTAAPTRVSGWAQDTRSPEEPVALEITVDGAPLLCVLANVYRADLRRAGLVSGCHAFDVAALSAGFTGTVAVRRITDGSWLPLTVAAGALCDQRAA